MCVGSGLPKNGDGWNEFDEKKLLLSSNKPNLANRVAVSITVLPPSDPFVNGPQFVLISVPLLMAVVKLSANRDCDVFSRFVRFCFFSTSCWVAAVMVVVVAVVLVIFVSAA